MYLHMVDVVFSHFPLYFISNENNNIERLNAHTIQLIKYSNNNLSIDQKKKKKNKIEKLKHYSEIIG